MNNIYKEVLDLITKSYYMNDEVFAQECTKLFNSIPANVHINLVALQKVISNKVFAYCKLNKIDIANYDGPLHYRIFKV